MKIEKIRLMKKLAALVVLALVLFGLALVLWDYVTVDTCLDNGGRWDAANSRCDGADLQVGFQTT